MEKQNFILPVSRFSIRCKVYHELYIAVRWFLRCLPTKWRRRQTSMQVRIIYHGYSGFVEIHRTENMEISTKDRFDYRLSALKDKILFLAAVSRFYEFKIFSRRANLSRGTSVVFAQLLPRMRNGKLLQIEFRASRVSVRVMKFDWERQRSLLVHCFGIFRGKIINCFVRGLKYEERYVN